MHIEQSESGIIITKNGEKLQLSGTDQIQQANLKSQLNDLLTLMRGNSSSPAKTAFEAILYNLIDQVTSSTPDIKLLDQISRDLDMLKPMMDAMTENNRPNPQNQEALGIRTHEALYPISLENIPFLKVAYEMLQLIKDKNINLNDQQQIEELIKATESFKSAENIDINKITEMLKSILQPSHSPEHPNGEQIDPPVIKNGR